MNDEATTAALLKAVNDHRSWKEDEWAQLCAVHAAIDAVKVAQPQPPKGQPGAPGKFGALYAWLREGGFDVQGRMFELEHMGDEGNGIVARRDIPGGERIMEVPHRSSFSPILCAKHI